LLKGIEQVVDVLFANVLDGKVVYDEAEGYGPCDVAP
jgi:hypothetical protein